MKKTECCEVCYDPWGLYCEGTCKCHSTDVHGEEREPCCDKPRKTISVSTKWGTRPICNNCGKDWKHTPKTTSEDYETSDASHVHCWESKKPPCGQKIEHLKCCLCERLNPKVVMPITPHGVKVLHASTPEETPNDMVEGIISEFEVFWDTPLNGDDMYSALKSFLRTALSRVREDGEQKTGKAYMDGFDDGQVSGMKLGFNEGLKVVEGEIEKKLKSPCKDPFCGLGNCTHKINQKSALSDLLTAITKLRR